jgi:hypothetical protein
MAKCLLAVTSSNSTNNENEVVGALSNKQIEEHV